MRSGLICVGLCWGVTAGGCKGRGPESFVPPVLVVSGRLPRPPVVDAGKPIAAPGQEGEGGPRAEARVPGTAASALPLAAPGDVAALDRRTVSVSNLIELLGKKTQLRNLLPTEGGLGLAQHNGPLAGLVPAFAETVRDETTWQFEGMNSDGLVRAVTLTFAPARVGGWQFHAVSIRVHADDPPRAFADVRRRATAALGKPKWMDLGGIGRTAWSLGDQWELTAAILQGGEIQLRSGLPARN